MAGLRAGHSSVRPALAVGVDGRVKPGHDKERVRGGVGRGV